MKLFGKQSTQISRKMFVFYLYYHLNSIMSLEDQIFSLRSAIVSAKRAMPYDSHTIH